MPSLGMAVTVERMAGYSGDRVGGCTLNHTELPLLSRTLGLTDPSEVG